MKQESYCQYCVNKYLSIIAVPILKIYFEAIFKLGNREQQLFDYLNALFINEDKIKFITHSQSEVG